jgi:hypothetical protein
MEEGNFETTPHLSKEETTRLTNWENKFIKQK